MTTTDTPRTDAYYAGKGCECSAHNRSECGCDVDWTDPRIYELQDSVERLRTALQSCYWATNTYDGNYTRACDDVATIAINALKTQDK